VAQAIHTTVVVVEATAILVAEILVFTIVAHNHHNVKDKQQMDQAAQALLEVEDEAAQDVLEW
jgi:cbb3-type cytochrome oxidase subunit 3